MSKNSLPRIALWITLSLAFTAGAVSLLVLAVASGSGSDDGPRSGGGGSTSWYTTRPPETSDDPGDTEGTIPEPSDPGQGGTPEPTGGGTEEPTGGVSPIPTEPSGPINATTGPSELPTPVTIVTQTVVAVPAGGGGDGAGSLITAFGSLLSGAAAVGTLLHAVHLSRQNRSAAATDDDARAAPSS
ncbi:hypothetical protein SAMN04487981_10282 [Streptomyces sp. cf386]|uniref:hypothetical protein n=1 Tax=Streptomyces sp. cf386 TaxID=1761904 RepID=UPI0008828422|nr:hypothetical protein [Streptomyces sp. cf386]SDM63797.1 hypothetical protein SAMN04487981_10282 [Streptomyces sp. cf386]